MSELEIYYLANLFRSFTVGLCVGASSIAITFYFYVVAKGQTDKSQNTMMHIVYSVLRVGMGLVIISEITMVIYHYHINNFIYWINNPELLLRLTIFGVILINAIGMQYRKVNMWIGPALAGGSWYAYFFFSVWIETESTFLSIFLGYITWLIFCISALALFRVYLTRKQKSYIGDGTYSTVSK